MSRTFDQGCACTECVCPNLATEPDGRCIDCTCGDCPGFDDGGPAGGDEDHWGG